MGQGLTSFNRDPILQGGHWNGGTPNICILEMAIDVNLILPEQFSESLARDRSVAQDYPRYELQDLLDFKLLIIE